MKSLLRVLLLALVVLAPATAVSQSHFSPDPAVVGARVLVNSKKFDAALRLLRPLSRDRADRIDILFLTGLAAMGAAEAKDRNEDEREALLDEAVAALRAILIDRPGLVRVRLELARAFFMKEDDELARRHFEQVLAGRPHPAVAANVGRFLKTIRDRRRWRGSFGLAVAPDSNLNTASANRTIWLDTPFGRLPFTLSEESARKSGIGLSVWGGGEYQHPLNARWRLRAGANAAAREYAGHIFDSHFMAGHVGPRWLIDPQAEASLLATVQRQWTGGAPESDQYGLRLEGRYKFSPLLVAHGRTALRQRDCRDCDWLDGPVGEVSLGAVWVALPTVRVGGNAGWNWARAEAEHWRTEGPQANLGATLALPLGFTVGLHGSLRWTDYDGSGARHRTIDREPREDKTQTLSLSVHNRAVTVLGFSPRLSLINEQRETNAQGLDYERDRAELSFVRQF